MRSGTIVIIGLAVVLSLSLCSLFIFHTHALDFHTQVGVRYHITNEKKPLAQNTPTKLPTIQSNFDTDFKVLSWQPRIFAFENFLSSEECDYLSANRMPGGRTAVVTKTGGAKLLENTVKSKIAGLRTSLVTGLREKISKFTQIPIENMEPTRVLAYDPGDYFRGHLDAHPKDGKRTTTRVATLFIYLSDDFEGGETVFPLAKPADGSIHDIPTHCVGFDGKDASAQGKAERDAYLDGSEAEFSEFYKGKNLTELGVVVQPKKGMALLWWNRNTELEFNFDSRHAGCPLLTGQKFAAVTWIHYRSLLKKRAKSV